MTPEVAVDLFREGLWLICLMVGLLVMPSLLVGLVVAMFQAATQINEMTLSFIPKLLAMCGVLVLLGPWLIGVMVDYIRQLIGQIPMLVS